MTNASLMKRVAVAIGVGCALAAGLFLLQVLGLLSPSSL